MGLFSKRHVSVEAEREALALEAAVMARIATITTSHDRGVYEDDKADLELLASMSAAPDMAVTEPSPIPDVLFAAASHPAPVTGGTVPAQDFTQLIPAMLSFAPPAASGEIDQASTVGLADGAVPGAGQPASPTAELPILTAEIVEENTAEHLGFAEAQTPFFATPAPVLFTPVPFTPVPFTPVGVTPVGAEASYPAPEVEDAALPVFDLVSAPEAELSDIGHTTPFALTAEQIAADHLLQETTKHLRSIGAVNILVAGQTGVGKSTLVNGVFGEAFAATAAGSPVTQHAEWFVSDTVPLRILDTRGLEAKDYSVTLNALQAEINNSRAQHDERNQLHMAWVCISTPSSRVQECELDIIKLLNKYDIPVIIVLTKYDDDEEFPDIVRQIMVKRGANFTDIVAVRALARKARPALGLEELVTATFTALPAAHRAAFAAAQKISRDLYRTTAETYVTVAASAAAAASIIPIPFADMAALAPIQASMLVGISNAFGVTLERSQIMQLITTVLGCLAATMAGGWVVGSVLKFIPGPGSLIGAMLNATVAGALTRTLGRTYIRFLYSFLEVNRRLPTADEIFDLFPTFYRAGRKTTAATTTATAAVA